MPFKIKYGRFLKCPKCAGRKVVYTRDTRKQTVYKHTPTGHFTTKTFKPRVVMFSTKCEDCLYKEQVNEEILDTPLGKWRRVVKVG